MGLPWQTSEVSCLACFKLRGSPALSPCAGAFLLNFMISGALASRAFLLESLTRALETAVYSKGLLWGWEDIPQMPRSGVEFSHLPHSSFLFMTLPFQAMVEEWKAILQVLASVCGLSNASDGWRRHGMTSGEFGPCWGHSYLCVPWIISSFLQLCAVSHPSFLRDWLLWGIAVLRWLTCAPRMSTHLLLNLK